MIHLAAFDELLGRTPTAPDLFHYTTASGLMGIVQSKHLWATHIRFLNDSREFRHAIELAQESIRELADAERDIGRHQGLIRLEQGIAGAGINICVASLTERGDDLGQWRGYGKGGYALGLSFEHLAARAAEEQWLFGPCLYQRDEQKQIMKCLLLEVLDLHLAEPEDSEIEELRGLHPGYPVALYLNRYAPFFKDVAFADEREWRLVSRPLSYVGMQMRPGMSTLIPYATFSLVTNAADSLPLKSVRVGPTPDAGLSRQGVEALLIGNRIRECVVESSTIPYRDW
jgi:hypothetical protein